MITNNSTNPRITPIMPTKIFITVLVTCPLMLTASNIMAKNATEHNIIRKANPIFLTVVISLFLNISHLMNKEGTRPSYLKNLFNARIALSTDVIIERNCLILRGNIFLCSFVFHSMDNESKSKCHNQ